VKDILFRCGFEGEGLSSCYKDVRRGIYNVMVG
jgi:hypothetical protein